MNNYSGNLCDICNPDLCDSYNGDTDDSRFYFFIFQISHFRELSSSFITKITHDTKIQKAHMKMRLKVCHRQLLLILFCLPLARNNNLHSRFPRNRCIDWKKYIYTYIYKSIE